MPISASIDRKTRAQKRCSASHGSARVNAALLVDQLRRLGWSVEKLSQMTNGNVSVRSLSYMIGGARQHYFSTIAHVDRALQVGFAAEAGAADFRSIRLHPEAGAARRSASSPSSSSSAGEGASGGGRSTRSTPDHFRDSTVIALAAHRKVRTAMAAGAKSPADMNRKRRGKNRQRWDRSFRFVRLRPSRLRRE
jgi:hypothetical protein